MHWHGYSSQSYTSWLTSCTESQSITCHNAAKTVKSRKIKNKTKNDYEQNRPTKEQRRQGQTQINQHHLSPVQSIPLRSRYIPIINTVRRSHPCQLQNKQTKLNEQKERLYHTHFVSHFPTLLPKRGVTSCRRENYVYIQPLSIYILMRDMIRYDMMCLAGLQ